MSTTKSDVERILEMLEDRRKEYASPGTYESERYYTRMEAKEEAFEEAISSIKWMLEHEK